jgi:hypothetical protein
MRQRRSGLEIPVQIFA